MNMLMGGGLMGGSLGGGDKKDEGGGEKAEEDPEVIQARLEAEERRKEKHRKMEMEREKMRQGVRDKYGIKRKEDIQAELMLSDDDMVGGGKKANEPQEDGLMGQVGGMANKAKDAVGGVADTIKGFLPFGK